MMFRSVSDKSLPKRKLSNKKIDLSAAQIGQLEKIHNMCTQAMGLLLKSPGELSSCIGYLFTLVHASKLWNEITNLKWDDNEFQNLIDHIVSDKPIKTFPWKNNTSRQASTILFNEEFRGKLKSALTKEPRILKLSSPYILGRLEYQIQFSDKTGITLYFPSTDEKELGHELDAVEALFDKKMQELNGPTVRFAC